MAKAKYHWIQERINPQLGTYYVPHGILPIREAMRKEKCMYGTVIMHRFPTQEAYLARLDVLRKSGERVG